MIAHLARRFVSSLSRRPPEAGDERWAAEQLLAGEQALWERMSNVDRRHSITVARRFVERRPDATRPEIAGALLHDCGKVDSGLGTFRRVLATVVGPRTVSFRRYHDHEAIGARLAAEASADPVTVALIEGDGPAAPALRAADDL
ncbi:MAG: hypothetical protein ACK5OX_17205 [Desertimonas sp.]